MSLWDKILDNIPEVAAPMQKRLSFNEKLKWTFIILVLFYVLGLIPLFGLGANSLTQFKTLSLLLGAKFGSLISLGIGPIVTASIVLQLLNGSGLIKFDLTTHEGKRKFEGTQKLLSIFFIIFEASIYVFMGGLAPGNPSLGIVKGTSIFTLFQFILVFQLFLGGIIIMFMDEIVSKWGFGSGISLFIAAGVSQSIFVRSLSWLSPTQTDYATGMVIQMFQALSRGELQVFNLAFAAILSTIVVFIVAVYTQAMKVEIPLSFGRVRGQGMRWPLNFIYTSNIPVILVAALFANMQLWARLLNNWGIHILGTVSPSGATSGLISWLRAPNIVKVILEQGTIFIGSRIYLQAIVYVLAMIVGCVIFSYFWVQTSGMDAKSQAKNILWSGLQIPGFRKDQRILERLLDRYIGPLTIMGGIAIGLLAALADLTGALGRGTGILLAVMIVYQLYEEITREHMMDMYPALRKMIKQ